MHHIDDIDTLADLRRVLASRTSARTRLRGLVVSSVDVTPLSDELRTAELTGAVFLGCTMSDDLAQLLRSRGALLFPEIPTVPFDPYRGSLYTADELYGDGPYDRSLDARVYAWAQHAATHRSVSASLAVAVHDHAITTALDELLLPIGAANIVGVMGGHALGRDEPGYARAARLGRDLARAGRTVLTGGGPGAMEAVNLGAYLAGEPDDAIDRAVAILAGVPSFRPDIGAWADRAADVRRLFPGGGARSVGIPTWFYGHEPPNQFAGHIAKFFLNPLREDTLVSRCGGGIIFLPGAAGTVQEIFEDACENYYADRSELVAPMVLVGQAHWQHEIPAWAVLQALGAGRTMGERLHLVDDADAAAALLTGTRRGRNG